MVLPSLRLQWISEEKGYGLFATEFIPKGTVTYCQDPLDIVIKQADLSKYPQALLDSIHKFAFEPPNGDVVLGWDNAKYINHCCSPSTLSTGYEFELAVRDVEVGEELTTDYRLFTKNNTFAFSCENPICPRSLMSELPLIEIDQRIQSALLHFRAVAQPLSFLISSLQQEKLNRFLEDPDAYISVAEELPC
jgi:hypothetical protein